MSAVRFPIALACGLLFTLGVFTVLFRFVDGPVSPPDLSKVVDVTSTPLRPTPPPPPPIRQPHVEPPKLIPQPGHGRGIEVADPPRHDPPPRIERLGGVPIETYLGRTPTGGIDREPIPLVRVEPDYPPRALASETEGWVQVQFTISATGPVRDARVVAAEPRGVFDDAALKAIGRWRYSPKIEGGVQAERVGLQTIIRFQLAR
jgi:protein TonB